MADTSALLAQYLSVKSQINYYQLEETKWANLHENMAAKLSRHAALDIEYDMMQSTYDTLLDELNAQADSLKTQLGNAAKDTGMLDS